mmetsp:Transcript_7598/g.19667  ORF Transcript_7598/g.19667 Transcript_7598/m.19667 type:complete len:538 (-) Transcript_7598:993-2606(-)
MEDHQRREIRRTVQRPVSRGQRPPSASAKPGQARTSRGGDLGGAGGEETTKRAVRRPLGGGGIQFTQAVQRPDEEEEFAPGAVNTTYERPHTGGSRGARPGSALTKRDLVSGDVLEDYSPQVESSRVTVNSTYDEREEKLRRAKEAEKQKRAARQKQSGMMMNTGMDRPGTAGRPSSSRTSATEATSVDVLGNLEDEEEDGIQTMNLDLGGSAIRPSVPKTYIDSRSPTRGDSRGVNDLQRRGLSSSYDPNEVDDVDSTRVPAAHVGGAVDTPAASMALAFTDMKSFLSRPAPRGDQSVLCYIKRDKGKIGRMYPSYYLYLKDGDRFLLAARRRKKSKSSNYLISTNREDLSRDSNNYFGKVRSNFVGTEFTVFDNGVNPKNDGKDDRAGSHAVRKELGVVLYDTNVLGTRGPRKMTVFIPQMLGDGSMRAIQPRDEDESMSEMVKREDFSKMSKLINKPPKWNEELGAYCLNFNGRVTVASVKNFQLVSPSNVDRVVLQFGKVANDMFTMDFKYPLSALQAFSIVLSSFDNKLACE